MRLQDLRQKLYSRQSDIESRKPQTDTYDPRTKISQPATEEKTGETTEETKKENKDWVIETGTTQKQKTFMVLTISILAGALIMGGGAYVLYRLLKKDFKQQQVQLKIEVPPAVNLNEGITVTIPYSNNNPVSLKDTHITVETPPNFAIDSSNPTAENSSKSTVQWNLGELTPQKSGTMEINGRFTGREEDSVSFKSLMTYTPSNFNSKFQNEASASTKVIGVPLSLFIESTRTVASGYAISYQIKVRNNGNDPFQELRVNMDYPSGFAFVNSSLPLTGDNKNVWNIPTILGNEEKVLTIEGRMEGRVGDQKYLTVHIGKEDTDGFKEYIKKEAATDITEPPVVISQEVKDGQTVVHKGDELSFTVNYANKSDRPISQAIIKVKLAGDIFDLKEVGVDDGGWYDSNNKEIVWQGGNAPSLALIDRGAQGKLGFRVKVANYIPFTADKKSNFTGQTTVSIESPEIPTPIGANKIVIGNTLDFKLSSTVGLKSSGFYSDGTIPNSGPIPPTIGKKTTYTIHWTVTNAFNDLRGVEVKAVLPYGVEWADKAFPSKNGVEYRERTKEVIWNLERIPAGAGVDKPSSNLVFQIALTPTENDAGKSLELMGETSLKGTDTFSQETINLKSEHITTSLPDDKSMTEDMGTVIRPGEESFSSSSYSSEQNNENANANNNKNN